jgi:hypothetical protein
VNLNDLADVSAPNPGDLERLVFDADSGLWVPGGWVQSLATDITYPAGDDNGWFLETVGMDAFYSTAALDSPPEAALVAEFTVTEAMVPGGIDDAFGPVPGLWINVPFDTSQPTVTVTMRVSVRVNGEVRATNQTSALSTRLRAANAVMPTVAVGDVVKVYAWCATASSALPIAFVAWTPVLRGWGVSDRATLNWWTDMPSIEWAPAPSVGLLQGSTTTTANIVQFRQNTEVLGVTTSSAVSTPMKLWARPSGGRSVAWAPQSGGSADLTTSGLPLVINAMRFKAFETWHLEVPLAPSV